MRECIDGATLKADSSVTTWKKTKGCQEKGNNLFKKIKTTLFAAIPLNAYIHTYSYGHLRTRKD